MASNIPKGAETPKLERETVGTRSTDAGWIYIYRSDGELRGAIWWGQVIWYRSTVDRPYETTVAFLGNAGTELVGCTATELRDALQIARREDRASTETNKKVKRLLEQHEAAQAKTSRSAA